MKLNINSPSLYWEEAAIIAREQEAQGLLPDGKANAIQIIKKFTYLTWRTQTTVHVEFVK